MCGCGGLLLRGDEQKGGRSQANNQLGSQHYHYGLSSELTKICWATTSYRAGYGI